MSTTPALTYDLPESVPLVRHAVAADLTALGRHCAAALVATADTRDAWALVGRDVEALSFIRREGTYGRGVLAAVVDAMARGAVDRAVDRMARECGMGVEAWEADERRLMDRAGTEAA